MGIEIVDPHDVPPALPGVAWATGLTAAALGLSALIGWVFDVQMLKQFSLGLVSMRPTTAVCLVLVGIAVATLIPQPGGRWIGLTATTGSMLIAGISVLEYALDRDLLVDRLMFRSAVDRELYGGRMALSTALALVLMALALVAAYFGKRPAAQVLGIVVFTGGAVAVLGYLYGERRLYAIDEQSGMAFNTALGITLVSLGLLAAIPGSVLTHLFRRPAPGAVLSRRLLPWITIVMPVIGWLRIEGERRGLFGTGLGTSIMVFAGSILVTVTARLATMTMDRLATALNHAWHQYGLASASEHTRAGENWLAPQSIEVPDTVPSDGEADLRESRPQHQ
jgi:hypothetical protein